MGARTPQHEIRTDREHCSPGYATASLFVNRWSPRLRTGDTVDEDEEDGRITSKTGQIEVTR